MHSCTRAAAFSLLHDRTRPLPTSSRCLCQFILFGDACRMLGGALEHSGRRGAAAALRAVGLLRSPARPFSVQVRACRTSKILYGIVGGELGTGLWGLDRHHLTPSPQSLVVQAGLLLRAGNQGASVTGTLMGDE